jgi:hypothetical protein
MSAPKGFKVIRTPEEAHKAAHEELLHKMNNLVPVKGKRVSYHVAPRYTPGSPALVDFGIAKRVAWQEAETHQRLLTGVYDDAEADRATKLGLAGISYAMDERAECWIVTDLITGQMYIRMFDRNWKTPGAAHVLANTLRRKYMLDDVRSYDGQAVKA